MSIEPGYSQRFIVEAREHLASMTSDLIALERGEDEPGAHFERLLRSAHSIKGGAGFTGRRQIEQLAHAVETVLERVRDGRMLPTADVIDTLLSALDRLGALVDDLEHSDRAEIADVLSLLQSLGVPDAPEGRHTAPSNAARQIPAALSVPAVRCVVRPTEFPLSEQMLTSQQKGAFLYGVKLDWFECEEDFGLAPLEVAARLAKVGTVLDSRMELSGPPLAEGLPFPPLWYRAIISSPFAPEQFAPELGIACAGIVRLERVDNGARPESRASAEPPRRATAATGLLRIPVSLIDRMMSLAGELVLVRNQAVHAADPTVVHLRQLMRRLDSVTNDLQDAALRMRMQPVGTLFDRFPRLVRDLARQLGKQIEIRISGSEVEVDKTILEMLSDPLTHLVRNSCDHGIELPEERTRSGKAPLGVISLSARQQGGRILIEIRDDGRGLDRAAIQRKALQHGVRTERELDAFSDRQVYELILLSGFSTASRVTDLSGRGVGMDVVRTNLEQVGGVLEIDSTPGQGTSFTLSLPLTLAIVPCVLVCSDGQRFALPQRDVEEIVLLEPGRRQHVIECSHDEELLRLRGRLLPITRLSEVLARHEPFTAQTRAEIVGRYHPAREEPARMYVAVLKIGSQRVGLVVDDLLDSEEIVVMPLHPLLRPLGVYSGATILGDGEVALILNGEGVTRHGGLAHRGRSLEGPLPAIPSESDQQRLLLFRYGPAELLALPLEAVRRVIRIEARRIERVGDRELINVEGAAINVLRLDRFLAISPCPDRDAFYLILPCAGGASVGLLASDIVDTPTVAAEVDPRAGQADGTLGSMLIRDRIALFLDLDRIVETWHQATDSTAPALPILTGRRILVVEDTQFFRQLITNQLRSAGHEVVLAVNGREGLDRLAEGPFDLVVSDIEMPVMDGMTFARHVRDEPRFASLPMLAVTTLTGQEDRQRALASGFDAYEIKLDRRRFLTCVNELLQRGRPRVMLQGACDHE